MVDKLKSLCIIMLLRAFDFAFALSIYMEYKYMLLRCIYSNMRQQIIYIEVLQGEFHHAGTFGMYPIKTVREYEYVASSPSRQPDWFHALYDTDSGEIIRITEKKWRIFPYEY